MSYSRNGDFEQLVEQITEAIVARLNAEFVKGLQHPDVKAFLAREGIDAVGSSPPEAAAFYEREIAKFAGIMKIAGVKAE